MPREPKAKYVYPCFLNIEHPASENVETGAPVRENVTRALGHLILFHARILRGGRERELVAKEQKRGVRWSGGGERGRRGTTKSTKDKGDMLMGEGVC